MTLIVSILNVFHFVAKPVTRKSCTRFFSGYKTETRFCHTFIGIGNLVPLGGEESRRQGLTAVF